MVLITYFAFTYLFAYNIKYGLLASCNNNEILSKCANKLCGYTNCTQIDEPVVCVESSTVVCEKGCICKDKYLRADNGTCIPYTQCPNYGKCTKENEYYDMCPSPCISRVCGVNKLTSNCTDSSEGSCLAPACICTVGFYRNYDGNCVVASLCGSNASLATTTSTETQSSEATTTMSTSTSSTLSSTLSVATCTLL
ncbi:inducible metalloproteinase inhibitor protein-like [Aricia agestis]|uniref:inducible metalloproteinase inhibitor protein-like n=1 Tax=Aricia agestis TaxID=91739 RepID=UPI001C2017AA|nr:inducible metalloproteinase inhibitor protein-like [Aricia agestis]